MPVRFAPLLMLFLTGLLATARPVEAAPTMVPPEVLTAQQQRAELIEQIAPSFVAIFAAGGKGGGSGVIISPDGYTVTNFHVVQGQGGFLKCGLNDGKIYDAVLVGIDPTGDVALIKLLGREDFPAAKIGDSDAVQVGDPAIALGNPFLLANDLTPTVTWGMVSGTHRYQYPAGTFLEYTDCLQVDASINPGNSGGPLFNRDGEVIGINGRISVEKRGKVNVGAGYAISINQVMNFLDHLKSGRIVDHATLGATVISDSSGAVIVRDILEDSPAWRRGLRSGDELVSFAGRPIRSVNQFKNILGIYPKGWRLPLSYRRDGKQFDTNVQLMALHTRAELTPGALPDEEPTPPGPDDPKSPEGPDSPEKPRQPLFPHPMLGHGPPPAPKEYAHLYEEKPGFANYYFNRLHTDRLLDALADLGDFSNKSGLWTLTGKDAAGQLVQFKIASDTIASRIGNAYALQALGEEPADEPQGTGGLLTALHHLQQLLQDPRAYFTELYYVGSEPGDDGQRVDVLIATRGLTTSRWYFSRPDARLIGVDFSLSYDVDPCIIRFEDHLKIGSETLPKTWSIRHAEQDVLSVTLEAFTFEGGQP